MTVDVERTALKEWAVLVDAMARGDIKSLRRSDCPNPGRSIANRWVCSANLVQVGS